jgi:hypothetical protein
VLWSGVMDSVPCSAIPLVIILFVAILRSLDPVLSSLRQDAPLQFVLDLMRKDGILRVIGVCPQRRCEKSELWPSSR